MKRKFCIFIALVTIWLQLIAQDKDVFVLVHDSVETFGGVKLATDIYLPEGNKTYPALLIRTPYQKDVLKGSALAFIKQGYAVVVQDCRGKFGSGGDFYAFKDEREDGLRTIEWIKRQNWYNGKIAGYGGSYVGYTQWAISDQLDAICAELTGADVYELLYPQGLFSLATAFSWGLVVDSRTVNPISPEKIFQSYQCLPLSVADDSTYKDSHLVNDWLLHENNDSYWKSINHRGAAKGTVLSIAGWYDIFLPAQINDFIVQARENPHPGSRMVIGPWCHGLQSLKKEYGGEAKTGNRGALQERFLAKNILAKDVSVMEVPFTDHKFNFFIMERNEYFGSERWTPREVKEEDFFIANGRISQDKPGKSGQQQFEYDPMDPYPSLGGTFLGLEVGPAVQNKNINRPDQWAFESDVLTDPLTLLGSVSASLYVSSTAEKTDFVMLVQDVFPNDTIVNIQEGGMQVKADKNKVVKVELKSWPTGYQLNSGHKLRVVITSSWFPRYNRSMNKDEPIYSVKESAKAVQTIYTGPKYPSKITLPLLNIKP